MNCPQCRSKNPADANFCMKCATPLNSERRDQTATPEKQPMEGERKHATVMFSDLSGYTAMTEKLDPEEVKSLMGGIFKKAEGIVEKYGGTVERFFGDEVMVLFGVPKAHEDDPVRAIHAALEIHQLVENLSPAFEKAHQTPLKMHTGINTGLIITGDEYIGKGRHGLTGDTINLAKRLTSLAAPGEIIVGPDTHWNAKRMFSFDTLDPVRVKGKKDAIQPFKINDTKTRVPQTKQLKGVRADLIGRTRQLLQFGDAVSRLKAGKGSLVCVTGHAGSGKSRLKEEFKNTTSLVWLEGFTYPYTQNTPYYPIISLFNHAMNLNEDDSPQTLKSKIDKSINSLVRDNDQIIPFIGTLYSLDYPQIAAVSPEYYKSKLFEAIFTVLSALADRTPTIICLEDLHWADPSSLELIRYIIEKIDVPILILTITRPVIKLFSESLIKKTSLEYLDITIDDLNTADAKAMVKSLLKTDQIPSGLEDFVENKAQGNPFYLEEIINSLKESGALSQQQNRWELTGEITESRISSSIHGVISARVDRLEEASRKIIQEASVIGRSFYYKIINHITETQKDIQYCLKTLENLDLIKSRQTSIDLEYVFKHALTQEVVYKGLLKTQRQLIHEKIGTVIEEIFHDRLPEFYETLAHHFSKGTSLIKAADYMVKSGEKSLKRYSLDESHDYFQQGYNLLVDTEPKTNDINQRIIDLLNRWAYVFYFKGECKALESQMFSHAHIADSIEDLETKGMFYTWFGFSLEFRAIYRGAEEYLNKALDIGKQTGSKKVMAHAYTWLSWVYSDLGQFAKGIECGHKARELADGYPEAPYVMFKSTGGICWNYFFMGHASRLIKKGEEIVRLGDAYAEPRSLGMGHVMICGGYNNFGDFSQAVSSGRKATKVTTDPMYTDAFTLMLAQSYLMKGSMEEAGDCLESVIPHMDSSGNLLFGDIATVQQGPVLVDRGQMSRGMKQLLEIEKTLIKQGRKGIWPLVRLVLGKVFLEITLKTKPVPVSVILKNIGFIIRNAPTSFKKAVYWYEKAIEVANELDAPGIKAQAFLDLGILYKARKKYDPAKEHFEAAIPIFEDIGAYAFLKQAKKELETLTG